MEERQNASDWREVEEWLNDMKQNSEEEYREYMDSLRCSCYIEDEYADPRKGKKMLISGELKNTQELKEWYEKENKRLEPIRKDNDIAFHGTDEEVIELAKRICPERLKAKEILIGPFIS